MSLYRVTNAKPLTKKSVYPLYVLLNMKLKGVLARHAGVSTAYTYQPF
jgi:hypothetical protein